MPTVQEKLARGPMGEGAIVTHRFTPDGRNYEVLVGTASNAYCYRFTHCVLAQITTNVSEETWHLFWEDEPDSSGVKDVCWSGAHPRLSYLANSSQARDWSERLGHTMHKVGIETNGHLIQLIFHDVEIVGLNDGGIDILLPAAVSLEKDRSFSDPVGSRERGGVAVAFAPDKKDDLFKLIAVASAIFASPGVFIALFNPASRPQSWHFAVVYTAWVAFMGLLLYGGLRLLQFHLRRPAAPRWYFLVLAGVMMVVITPLFLTLLLSFFAK